MSRLTEKIKRAEQELEAAEERLDRLRDKQYRAGFKRRRKQHRKKMASDPLYRIQHRMSQDFAKKLYEDCLEESPFLTGLRDELKA